MRNRMRARLPFATIMALMLNFLPVGTATAQGQFTPAITVNESVITRFELDQRRQLLELFRTPGDLTTQAREGLIDDRCLLYTSPSPRDRQKSRMPSSA